MCEKKKEEKAEATEPAEPQPFRFREDLVSDVLYEAFGKNAKELFRNAAKALYSVICQIEKVKPVKSKAVSVAGKNLQDLLFNWLQELIVIQDVDQLFLCRFDIEEISETSLKATVWGEPMTPEKGGTVVKAVTYYKFALKQTPEGYKATVSLDI